MKQLSILSVSDMLHLHAMKLYYKFSHKGVPEYFHSFRLDTQGSKHNHNTRHRDDIRTNRTRIKLIDKCLRNFLPGKINSTPNHLLSRIQTHCLKGFASALKTHLLNGYKIECNDESCFVCQRITTRN